MAMFERPVKEIRYETPFHARRRIAAKERADTRAQLRFAWATFARRFEGSHEACVAAVRAAIEAGELPMPLMKPGQTLDDCAPGAWVIRRLRTLPTEAMSVEKLRRAKGGGRPRAKWDAAIELEFETQISAGRFPGAKAMHRYLLSFAAAKGIDSQVPTYQQVVHRMSAVPLVRRAVARHGKRAAIADAVVHGNVPAEHAHDVWVLDELDLPVWIKVYDWRARLVVAVKAVVVVIVDGASGVIVSYFVANPLARDCLRGVDRWDVMAALASGMFAELAAPACRQFAGWMPRVLRYDKAKAHHEAGERLKTVGVDVPKLPGLAPWARGQVENAVKHVKNGVRMFKGHDEFYGVAEYERGQLKAPDYAAVRTTDRLPELTSIQIVDLHTIESLSRELDTVVREFNERVIHEEFGMPRAARYGLTLRADRLRPGRDAISMLEPHRIKVSKRGFVVNRIAFEARTPAVEFYVGTRTDLRIDPALRGIFATDWNGHLHFMRPKREAALVSNAADVAHAIHSTVSAYDIQSRAAKQLLRQRDVGVEGAELADAVAEEELDAFRRLEDLHRLPDDPVLAGRPGRPRATATATSPVVTATPAARKKQPAKNGAKKQSAGVRPAPPIPPPMPPVPGVVPITQAPSHGRPPAASGMGSPAPMVRRGIIRNFS